MSSQLLDCLHREHALIEGFIGVIDQEAKAMIDGDFGKLPELAEQKSALAGQVKLAGREREQLQLAAGYAGGRSGGDAASAAGDPALQQAWHNLLETAARAQERNHRNGVMIHTHLDFTRQTIGFLRSSGQALYGPDGIHNAGDGGKHSLAVG